MPSFLTDANSQQWQIGVVESGGTAAYTLTAVAGSGPASILLQDTATGTIYALTIFLIDATHPELQISASAGSPSSVQMVALSGTVYALVVTNGALSVVLSSAPAPVAGVGVSGRRTWAIPGRGTRLFMSADAKNYVGVAQLKSIVPTGSRQTHVDQTNVSTPDNFTRPLAVRVDSGEIDVQGVLDPQNTDILQLGTAHASLAIYFCRLVLSDGTEYDFQAFVAEYVPFTVQHNKAIAFSAKLRISGSFTGPAGVA